MKTLKTPLKTAEDSDYNVVELLPFKTLAEGADVLGITPQRMSRVLRIMQIPVYRKGYTILLDTLALSKARAAVVGGVVRPGRKKKSETA